MAFLLFGCSTKKDAFINRGYHAMTAQNNILYNGEIAFQNGLNEINEKYRDNYWEILPIEPISIEEGKIDVPDYKIRKTKKAKEDEENKSLTPFELAEEKAVKAIQKHSMNIGGKEKNKKIDDAYLLLGKSRYYTSRFVPAMEAFNYVIKNYPEASLIDETTVWKAKTNIRMQNEETAINSLLELVEKEDLEEAVLEDAFTTMALGFYQIDSTYQTINALQNAVEVSKNPTTKARNLFILGQLYRKENSLNNSQQAFQDLIDYRKAPYKYKIHAEIEQIKNFELAGKSSEVIPRLEKLIEVRENRPYLDELYYHLAILEMERGDKEAALANYQKSVHAKNAKPYQKGLSYEASGNIYFDDSEYVKASSFYDSVLQVSGNLDTKRIRKLRRKKQSLESVLVFEEVIRRNDSIWHVLSMDREEQNAHFENYIAELKQQEKEAKEQAEFLEDLKRYEDTGLASAQAVVKPKNKKGDWYFYSDETVSFGASEFRNTWGNITLSDNWRQSDKTVLRQTNSNSEIEKSTENSSEPEKYQVNYYVDQLPSTLREIDSISNLRSSTYYQLGLIYKEQFQEYELAAETLETLLEIFPEDKLVLGTYYHLFRTYEAMGNTEKADYYSNIVVRRFPNSVFADMIMNPDELVSNESNKTPEGRYREIYFTYKSGDYLQTVYDISKALRTFEGTPIVPKLELLKAYALAKVKGKKAFLEALDYIVLNYANTDEGKKAKELLRKLK